MGFYINPPDKSKEEWLLEHGQNYVPTNYESVPDGMYVICWKSFQSHTAAGVAYDALEFDRMVREAHSFFLVPKEKVYKLLPELNDGMLVRLREGYPRPL